MARFTNFSNLREVSDYLKTVINPEMEAHRKLFYHLEHNEEIIERQNRRIAELERAIVTDWLLKRP